MTRCTFWVLLCTVGILACRKMRTRFDVSELPGHYAANFRDATDEIDLRRDGTYLHTARRNGRETIQDGRWEINQPEWGTVIDFSEFRFTWPFPLAVLDKGGWSATVQANGSTIMLVISSDDGRYYLKQR